MKMTTSNMLKVKSMLQNLEPEESIKKACGITSNDLVNLILNPTFHRIKNKHPRISDRELMQARNFLAKGNITQSDIALELGMSRSLVTAIANDTRHKDRPNLSDGDYNSKVLFDLEDQILKLQNKLVEEKAKYKEALKADPRPQTKAMFGDIERDTDTINNGSIEVNK